MYGRTFASTVVLFWGLPAHAQELRVVLDDTFASDPQIRIARANSEQTQASLDLARAEGRPHLSLTTYASIETVDPQNLYSRKGGRFGAGIDADVPIFSGGEIRYRIRSARYVRDESLATLDETIVGIASTDAAINEEVSFVRVGVFNPVPKVAGAAWVGGTTKIYFDATAKAFTATAGGVLCGVAAASAASADTTGSVLLTGQIAA